MNYIWIKYMEHIHISSIFSTFHLFSPSRKLVGEEFSDFVNLKLDLDYFGLLSKIVGKEKE